MVKAGTAFLAVSVLAVALIAAPSATSLGPAIKVAVAKHKDGPYRGEINSNMDDGQTRSFWFRVRTTSEQDDLELVFEDLGSSDDDGFKTRWFKAGNNVSSDVEGSGYEFKIDPGQSKYLNAKQTAPDPTAQTCLAGYAELPTITGDTSIVVINDNICAF
jgi:hypothetical protein